MKEAKEGNKPKKKINRERKERTNEGMKGRENGRGEYKQGMK